MGGPEIFPAVKTASRYILKGIIIGAIVGVVAGHPLFRIVRHLQHYFSHLTPLDLSRPILRSFSLETWPTILFFAVLGAAVGAILGRLYYRLETHRRSYQSRLRALAAEISLVEERERRRLATELHEQVGQMLAVTQVKLGTLAPEITSPAGQRALEEARRYLEECISYIRSLTGQLSPPALYDLGFAAAVAWLAREIRDRYGVPVELQQHPITWPPIDDSQILLFIIFRDLMTLVVHQAEPGEIRIVMQPVDGNLRLRVEHDGATLAAKDHQALFGIRERLERLHGTVEVETPPEQGTVITLRVPLFENPL
jgi:signal transduction histidine kinase